MKTGYYIAIAARYRSIIYYILYTELYFTLLYRCTEPAQLLNFSSMMLFRNPQLLFVSLSSCFWRPLAAGPFLSASLTSATFSLPELSEMEETQKFSVPPVIIIIIIITIINIITITWHVAGVGPDGGEELRHHPELFFRSHLA